ncbi:MAG: hypothetical protein JXB49_06180 [Bacteroidales bacterium]|nr:hypothetical protein [Bacteroidales bacterium]
MRLISRIKSKIPLKYKLFVKKAPYFFTYLLTPLNYNNQYHNNLDLLRRKINLYFKFFSREKELSNELDFINNKSRKGISYSFVFPYKFVFDYDHNSINVYKDERTGLFYVIHKGKKLYYSRIYQSEDAVKRAYNKISIEQDQKSPHRYINDDFNVEENDVVIDIGAAEGNFSLEVVEKASALYIIEGDTDWIEALNATFGPWKDKVHIISKYISDVDNEKWATLDNLFGVTPVNFIKIDAEGDELLILRSSSKVFSINSFLKLLVCTYHKKNDAKVIAGILDNYHFRYSYSDGYMLNIYDKLSPPYFRRGLIRAQK